MYVQRNNVSTTGRDKENIDVYTHIAMLLNVTENSKYSYIATNIKWSWSGKDVMQELMAGGSTFVKQYNIKQLYTTAAIFISTMLCIFAHDYYIATVDGERFTGLNIRWAKYSQF